MAGSEERIQDYYFYNRQQEHHQVLQNRFNNNGGFEVGESSNSNNLVNSQGPIGLKLIMSTSLINQIRMANLNQETKQKESKLYQPNLKLKASSVSAFSFQIGSWKVVSQIEGDLTVKFYYGKKKLVWESLFGPLKKKVEIRWSQVSAINTFVDEGNNGRLEIELKEQPQLCEETDFQPKKHTKWEPTKNDFTNGQASISRRHTIVCPPRVLDEPFKKLLQCDNRLLSLSQQPFPTHNSLCFDNQILDFSCNTSIQECPTFVSSNGYQRAVLPYTPNLVQPLGSCVGYSSSDLPMQVLNPPIFNQNARVLYCNQAWDQSRSDGILEIPKL